MAASASAPLCSANARPLEEELKETQILKENIPELRLSKSLTFQEAVGQCMNSKSSRKEVKRTARHHQMARQALKKEIEEMYRLRIFTSVPKYCPRSGCIDAAA